MLIFNFHHVERTIRHPERKHISITPLGLSRFIRTLRLMGMQIVSMQDVLAQDSLSPREQAFRRNARQVLLTFDDGYENNLLEALPVLEQEQCPATIFVLPGRFGGTNVWDQGDLPEEQRDRLMTLPQIRELAASPYVTIGSHGMLHRHLPELSDAALRFEIHESYRLLREALGERFFPVFAYPWGETDPRVVAMMETSPYRYAFTVQNGQWQESAHPMQVPRYSAFFRDGNPAVFMLKLLRHNLVFV